MIAVAIVVPAPIAPPAFDPVADRPYRIEVRETRSDDGTERRFASRRTVTFRRDADGWLAESTLDAVEHGDDEVGRMFATSNAGLLHRMIRVRLDERGHVVAVPDVDAALEALVAGIAANAPAHDPVRRDRVAAMVAALRAMPPAARTAMFASDVGDLIDADPRPPGTRPVTLPGRAPFPGQPLAGQETVSTDQGDHIIVRVVAATPDGSIRLTNVREIERRTGLVTGTMTTSETTLTAADGTRHVVRWERTLTVTTPR